MDILLRLLLILYIIWCILLNIHIPPLKTQRAEDEGEEHDKPSKKKSQHQQQKQNQTEEIITALQGVKAELSSQRENERDKTQEITTSLRSIIEEVASLREEISKTSEQETHQQISQSLRALEEILGEGLPGSLEEIGMRLEQVEDTLDTHAECLSRILTNFGVAALSAGNSSLEMVRPSFLFLYFGWE